MLLTLGMMAMTPGKFLMTTLGYWIAGPMAIWGAIALTIIVMVRAEDKWRMGAWVIGTVVVDLFSLLMSARFQPYPLSQVSLYPTGCHVLSPMGRGDASAHL